MSDHATVTNSRVDMGQRLFLAGFFLPFAFGPTLAGAGYGLTKNPWIALVGVANMAVLLIAAHYLYAGSRTAEKVLAAVAGLFLLAAVAVLIRRINAGTVHLAIQLAMPALFAAAIAIPDVRIYLGFLRGEAPPPDEAAPETADTAAVPHESIFQTGPDGVVSLKEDAKTAALGFLKIVRLATGLLVLGIVAAAALGVLSLRARGTGWTLFVAAILAFPQVHVLLTLGDDLNYLATTKGAEKKHLANIVGDGKVLGTFAIASIVVLALIALTEASFR